MSGKIPGAKGGGPGAIARGRAIARKRRESDRFARYNGVGLTGGRPGERFMRAVIPDEMLSGEYLFKRYGATLADCEHNMKRCAREG